MSHFAYFVANLRTLVLFTVLDIAVVYQIDKYEVCLSPCDMTHNPGNRIMNSCNLISDSGVLQFAESMLACLDNPPTVAISHLKELGITSGDSSLISGLDSENCQRIIKVLI